MIKHKIKISINTNYLTLDNYTFRFLEDKIGGRLEEINRKVIVIGYIIAAEYSLSDFIKLNND